jgi:hypothetical protein
MNFFEPETSYSAPTTVYPLSPHDEPLVSAAQSDTRGDGSNYYTVSELVVTASPITNSYAQDNIGILYDPGSSLDYTDYSVQRVDEAIQAGTNAYTTDSSTAGAIVKSFAQSALQRLYLAGASTQAPVSGPLGDSMTMGEAANFRLVNIVIGPHAQAPPAYTQAYADGSANIYIDPNRLGAYTTEFGQEKGLNYVIYHELGHAMVDARAYDSQPSIREQYANEYGQVLAEVTGAVYPNDTELGSVGGTVSR